MRNKTIIIIAIVCAVACQKKEVEQLPVGEDTTPVVEIKNTEYSDYTEYRKEVKVKNTERPDYAEYRKQWKRVNKTPIHEGYRLVDPNAKSIKKEDKEPVIINSEDLSFREVFSLHHRAQGEGHVFLWRGKEYTTNLADSLAGRKETNNED